MKTLPIEPIGSVRGGRNAMTDDGWGSIRAAIELDTERFTPDALVGLEDFSHVVVVFLFHRVTDRQIQQGARRPRENPNWPRVGIFAQRGSPRPNRIGVSVCRILRVDGTRIEVEGLDAVNGSPVLDLKPFMRGFEPRGDVHEPDWAREIFKKYW
ncbi:MAG TPA: TrmO family methyltransferase [Thermoanaerobaculia bacterium]|jgi:tRNA-Thr(GGU) m(6)t(6)A37 methyltransferase TsaA